MPKKVAYTECANCAARGPEAETVRESVNLATAAGWLTPQWRLRGERRDYCPACRHDFEYQMCEASGVRHQPGSPGLARYILTSHEGKKVSTCGIHLPQVIRELFAGGAQSLDIRQVDKAPSSRSRLAVP